jgi:hypothetical protein
MPPPKRGISSYRRFICAAAHVFRPSLRRPERCPTVNHPAVGRIMNRRQTIASREQRQLSRSVPQLCRRSVAHHNAHCAPSARRQNLRRVACPVHQHGDRSSYCAHRSSPPRNVLGFTPSARSPCDLVPFRKQLLATPTADSKKAARMSRRSIWRSVSSLSSSVASPSRNRRGPARELRDAQVADASPANGAFHRRHIDVVPHDRKIFRFAVRAAVTLRGSPSHRRIARTASSIEAPSASCLHRRNGVSRVNPGLERG